MVLAHSDRGAVKSAIAVANRTASYPPDKYGKIGEVVNAIVPPIQNLPPNKRTLVRSTATNARAQAAAIASSEPIIKPPSRIRSAAWSPPSTTSTRKRYRWFDPIAGSSSTSGRLASSPTRTRH
jgi:hypothetical protein